MFEMKDYLEVRNFILKRTNKRPKIGLILGSGLGVLAEEMEDAIHFSFEEIPHFVKPTAEGHKGELVVGKLNGVEVVLLNGRYHYYEGYTLDEITFPVRVMKLLGVEKLILTNACGAINTSFKPGDLMLITDHINLTGNNPLIGKNLSELGVRFPDATEVYSMRLREIAKDIAKDLGITLREGVYAWWTGPMYETPAEIKMIRVLGGDAVGMSTVPEAIVGVHAGMEVLGISCLTNMASGILPQKLSHQEVLDVAKDVRVSFGKIVKSLVAKI
ncbi:MAG: purine-nucleoside phosphorylase [Ignavibacteriales bacterium]|jgi:purine-nucleoside phosphorylase|nr:MAG: purine-nucleoside phosphorylase [Ignavibacteriales bacterium]